MLKETETERSLPIDDSAPNVVPPTPPLAAPSVLIFNEAVDQHVATTYECEVAASEEYTLLRRFFAYQSLQELKIRRLVLATPVHASRIVMMGQMAANVGSKQSRKRKEEEEERGGERAKRVQDRFDGEVVFTSGSTFGCTLGNIIGYLSGRQIPGERASILKQIRCFLTTAADAVRLMHGSDRQYLARGLASCRVAKVQRPFLSELSARNRVRIDSKYGNAGAALGCAATLLSCFHIMADRPVDCLHFLKDDSIPLVLHAASEQLEKWTMNAPHVDEEYWFTLGVEYRCVKRAALAARRVSAAQKRQGTGSEDASFAIREQLEWALAAAYPRNVCIDSKSHDEICDQISNDEFCHTQFSFRSHTRLEDASSSGACSASDVQVIPLSELGLDAFKLVRSRMRGAGEDGTDSESVSRSSQSHTDSSQRSHKSQKSSHDGSVCEPVRTALGDMSFL